MLDDGRNKPEEALQILESARERQARVLGPRSNAVAKTLNGIGIGLQHLKRFDESLAKFEEARSIYRERRHKGPHPDLMAVAFNIGSLHEQKGDFEAAAESYLEAQHIIEAASQPNSPNAAAARGNVGRMRLLQARLQEAEPAPRERRAGHRLRHTARAGPGPELCRDLDPIGKARRSKNHRRARAPDHGVDEGRSSGLFREVAGARRKAPGEITTIRAPETERPRISGPFETHR